MTWIGLIKIGERVTGLRPRRAMNSTSSTSKSELEEAFPLEISMSGFIMLFRGVGCSEAD